MEDDDLGSAGGGDSRAPVERADRGRELPAARLEVPHEPEQRCMHGEGDVVLAGLLSEPLGPGVVHPEAALEIDLAGVVAALEQRGDRRLRALAARDARRAEPNPSHPPTLPGRRQAGRFSARSDSVRRRPYPPRHGTAHPNRPARARHRSPSRRSLARGGRRDGMEPRGRRGVHARLLRQGILRRVHRGLARIALPRSRLRGSRTSSRRRSRLPPSQAARADGDGQAYVSALRSG